MSSAQSTSRAMLLLVIALAAMGAHAHGDHLDNIPEGEAISDDPIDSILWTHILLMTVAFGMIFPTGMVLGVCLPPESTTFGQCCEVALTLETRLFAQDGMFLARLSVRLLRSLRTFLAICTRGGNSDIIFTPLLRHR